jgi:O-antigen ligase
MPVIKQQSNVSITDPVPLAIKTCRSLAWASLILTLLVPLLVKPNLYFPFVSYRSLWFMGTVQISFFIWIFLSFHDKRYQPKLNPVLLVFAAFIFSLILSALLSADPLNSFWSNYERMTGLLFHFHLFAYFLVLSSTLRCQKGWNIYFAITVLIAAIISILATVVNINLLSLNFFFGLQQFVPYDFSILLGEGATLGNRSYLGSYLLIASFIALYLISAVKGRLKIAFIFAFMFISISLLLIPGARAMKGAFLVGLIVLALIIVASEAENKIIRHISLAALIFSFVVSLYIGISAFIEGTFVREKIMNLAGMPGRFANWEASFSGIKERFLLGWGLENFDVMLYNYFDPRVMLSVDGFVGEPWHDRAHNILIDNLVTGGLIGTVLYFGLIAYVLNILWVAYRKERKLTVWAPAIFTALFAAQIIQNLTVFDTVSSYMLLFIIFAYAAFIAEPVKLKLPAFRSLKPSAFRSAAALLLIGICFYFSFNIFIYKPYLKAIYVNTVAQDQSAKSIAPLYQYTLQTSPLGGHQVRMQFAEATIGRINNAATPELKLALLDEVSYLAEELKLSTEESPLYFRPYFTLGRLYSAASFNLSLIAVPGQGTFDLAQKYALMAEEALLAAIEKSPANVQAYWELAQVYIYQAVLFNDPQINVQAQVTAEKAVSIEPRFFRSHSLSVIVAANLLQDYNMAGGLIERAAQVNPYWEKALLEQLE